VTDGGRARFWAGLGAARRNAFAAMPDSEALLAAALAAPERAGQSGWLAADDFAAVLARHFDRDPEVAPRWWAHLHAADLHLALCCARGVPAALERFEARFGAEIARAARRFERPGLSADDLLQLLRTKLFTGDARAEAQERRPRIASYTGQGFLQNWVRVTTTRAFIDCCRGHAEPAEIPIAAALEAALPAPGADPELRLLKQEHLAHFRAAFAEAVAGLDASDRVVLRQHLVERLTIDQIGGLYHLHRATAARRLARARAALLDGTRAALARRLGLPPEQLAAVLEMVESRLEVSVERLLR
jgi:RNA polymerase sigma-70 factor (ECF subfamily)